MNDEGVCRTAPATPGLLNIVAQAQDILNLKGYQKCIIG